MKEKENILIAEFMGYTKDVYDHGINGKEDIWRNDNLQKGHYKGPWEFDYDRFWDSLMPVVEKIESLGYFCMINKWTSVYTGMGQSPSQIQITTIEGKFKLKNTYQAVLAFIKYYNKQK